MWLAAHVAAFLAIKNPHDLSVTGVIGLAGLLAALHCCGAFLFLRLADQKARTCKQRCGAYITWHDLNVRRKTTADGFA